MNLADKVKTHSNLTDTTIKKVNTDYGLLSKFWILVNFWTETWRNEFEQTTIIFSKKTGFKNTISKQ